MILAQSVTKISGPPGTGKSTTLLNVVDELLVKGVNPENIVYTTFTRAGAYEARDRACARFKLSINRLPYFRTLHSLCYQLLPSAEVMGPRDWQHLGLSLKLFFSASGHGLEEGQLRFQTKGDALLSLWSLSRLMLKPMDEIWARRSEWKGPEILRTELDRFITACKDYKLAHGKIDFADMLECWLAIGAPMKAEYVIIDEAQDLSALQWAVVEKLCLGATRVWIAGDDDQCIHEWNGADPRHFINLESSHYKVLPQSYRIPASVHRLAMSVIQRTKLRLEKPYAPRAEEGEVRRVNDIGQIDMRQGTWLLLAYNQYLLEAYAKHCRSKGLYFSGTGADSASDRKAVQAIQYWNQVAKPNGTLTGREAKHLYGYLGQVTRVTRGFKGPMGDVRDDAVLTYEILREKHGLMDIRVLHWSEALDLMPDEQRLYLRAVAAAGAFDQAPRIRISTIHGAKGGEADHVVLNTDLSQRTYDNYLRAPDPEHRVFYVGVTRARKSLWLLTPTSTKHYDL